MLVKICGLSSEPTLDAALEAGADRVGLVFFERSPRNVSLSRAQALRVRVDQRAVVVALTVDADDRRLGEIVEAVRPGLLQLHGSETPERVADVERRFGTPVIKALGISRPTDLAAVAPYIGIASELLFDAKPPGGSALPGGNGRAFDWSLLANLDLRVPFMLSGGLDAGNVGEAVAMTGADAVDVSSGVERSPGIKDPDKIRAFVRAAKLAAPAFRREGAAR